MDIFGTVVTAGQLAIELTKYCSAVKNAPDSAKGLRDELSIVSVLLTSFGKVIQEAHRHENQHIGWDEISSTMSKEEAKVINAFQEEIQKFAGRVDASRTQGLHRLTWPFKDAENNNLINKISRFKDTLNLILGEELL